MDSANSFVRATLGHKEPVGQLSDEQDPVAKVVELQLTQNFAAERSHGCLTAALILAAASAHFHRLLVGLVPELVQEELPQVCFMKCFLDHAPGRLLVRV